MPTVPTDNLRQVAAFGRAAVAGGPVAAPLPDDVEVSFEFFPPSSDGAENTLWNSIQRLAPLGPKYVSVTYGAGGTTRERTHATVKRLLDETDLLPAAHLTCVDATTQEIDTVAQDYWDMGVRHGERPNGARPAALRLAAATAGTPAICAIVSQINGDAQWCYIVRLS